MLFYTAIDGLSTSVYFYSPLNDKEVTVNSIEFLRGISHTLSRPATFIYLLVHEREMLVMWFLFGVP